MFEYVIFGVCCMIAGYITHKLTVWYRKQYESKVVFYILSSPDLQEKLKKLL